MIADLAPAIVIILAFGAVAAIVFVIGQFSTTQARIQQRVGAPVQSGAASRSQSLVRSRFSGQHIF